MSYECDKCGEHYLDCVCDDESLTSCSEFPLGLVASIIKRNLEEIQLMIAFQSLEEVGMCEEFKKYLNETQPKNIYDAMREFAQLHPDKFYIPSPMEPYGKFIIM